MIAKNKSFNKILKHTIAWKLANTVLVFLINLLMVRLLGAAGSGAFFYDIALISFILLILSGSLESGITYYASRDNSKIVLMVVAVLPLLVLQGFICWFILAYFHLFFTAAMAVMFVVSNMAYIYFSAFFYAKKWFVSLNIITCIVNFITVIILLFWLFATPQNNNNKNFFILTFIAGLTLQALLLITIIVNSIKNKGTYFNDVLPTAKKIIAYSSVAFVSNIAFYLVVRIDYYFVQKYCSVIALSNYVQVSKFGQLIIMVPVIIATVVFPYSAAGSNAMPLIKVQRLCRAITIIFIPVCAIIILTAYWVLPCIFGNGFNYMYIPLLLYLPGFYALSIVSVLAAHLGGKKLLYANMIASLLALAVVVTGDILLIPIAGINAAAAVSSAAYLVCFCCLLWFYKTRFNCNTVDFFSLKKIEIVNISSHFKNLITSSIK